MPVLDPQVLVDSVVGPPRLAEPLRKLFDYNAQAGAWPQHPSMRTAALAGASLAPR